MPPDCRVDAGQRSLLDLLGIAVNTANDLGTYFELMKATPKALRFRGRGYRNRQALRVIAETTPLPVAPAVALGELPLA